MLYAPTAPLLPHCCFLCHNGSGPFVDLQSDDNDVRDEGLANQFGAVFHLYMCVTCAMSAAQVVERDSPSQIVSRHVLAEERATHAAQAERCAAALDENESLRAALGVIHAFAPAMDGQVPFQPGGQSTSPPMTVSRPEPVTTDTVSTATPAPRKAARR